MAGRMEKRQLVRDAHSGRAAGSTARQAALLPAGCVGHRWQQGQLRNRNERWVQEGDGHGHLPMHLRDERSPRWRFSRRCGGGLGIPPATSLPLPRVASHQAQMDANRKSGRHGSLCPVLTGLTGNRDTPASIDLWHGQILISANSVSVPIAEVAIDCRRLSPLFRNK